MTALEKVRDWIATYPGYSSLDGLSVDYTDAKPDNGGLMPGGLTEISRAEDILGNIVVTNQYSFTLYFLLPNRRETTSARRQMRNGCLHFRIGCRSSPSGAPLPSLGTMREKKPLRRRMAR